MFQQAITLGNGLMMIAAVVYATYCVLLKRWKIPLSNWELIYMQGLFAVAMLCTSDSLMPTTSSLPLIAYTDIAASILAPWMWVKAINLIGADSSAIFMNLMPILVLSLATLFLGEDPWLSCQLRITGDLWRHACTNKISQQTSTNNCNVACN